MNLNYCFRALKYKFVELSKRFMVSSFTFQYIVTSLLPGQVTKVSKSFKAKKVLLHR